FTTKERPIGASGPALRFTCCTRWAPAGPNGRAKMCGTVAAQIVQVPPSGPRARHRAAPISLQNRRNYASIRCKKEPTTEPPVLHGSDMISVAFAQKCSTWRIHMAAKRELHLGVAAVALALGVAPTPVSAQQGAPAVSIGATDIGGVVRGPNGPEAGVWGIAGAADPPAPMSKAAGTAE